MSPCCFGRVYTLLVALVFPAHLSTTSTPVCPVRPPLDSDAVPQGDCQCSALKEIQCRGLIAVPDIDLNQSYAGRQTFRSLYLARQHISRLPAAAFAALNVRRIVLDFNPIGDRIDPRTFRGTVDEIDLTRLGLTVSRRRRTSVSRRTGDLSGAGSRKLQHLNDSAVGDEESRQPDIAVADRNRRRRHKPNDGVRKVGDSVKWERFPYVDYDNELQEKFNFGLKHSLTELSMGACGISNLPSGLLDDVHLLERLHLWGNFIETIPNGLFRRTERLTELLLWGNHIDELDAAAFDGLRGLRRLDLDRNRLTVLPAAAVARLASLRALRLADNRIHAVASDSFASLSGLRALRLDGNGIAYIYPRAFHGLGNLTVLALDRNAVHFLPDDVFVDLRRLAELHLSHNHVEHVWARTFRGLRSLHRLRLTFNRLGNLPNGVFGDSPSLRHIQLDGNRLQMVGRCALAPTVVDQPSRPGRTRLTLLLDANPLRCDCRMSWLLDVIRSGELRMSGTCWTDAVTPTPGNVMAVLRDMTESCEHPDSLKNGLYCGNSTARQF